MTTDRPVTGFFRAMLLLQLPILFLCKHKIHPMTDCTITVTLLLGNSLLVIVCLILYTWYRLIGPCFFVLFPALFIVLLLWNSRWKYQSIDTPTATELLILVNIYQKMFGNILISRDLSFPVAVEIKTHYRVRPSESNKRYIVSRTGLTVPFAIMIPHTVCIICKINNRP